MLTTTFNAAVAHGAHSQRRGVVRRQQGISLLIALIVLMAMTLSAVGLMRSVFTSNRIAGNLSFQQSATQAADVGVETALAWLQLNATGTTLHKAINIDVAAGRPVAYFATRQDPGVNQSWEQFWVNTLVPTGRINTLPVDDAGNTVQFVIQRMCAFDGDPSAGIGCSWSPAIAGAEGNSKGAGVIGLLSVGQTYYRITSRVVGPRNTVSFVQAVVAI